ncbi:MAG: ISNCY family transposase [bacterium]|nr:ISNCY family transposase [bacterium]
MHHAYVDMHDQLNEKEQCKFKIIRKTINQEITNGQAAKLLNLSVRQVRRLKGQVKEDGSVAVIHKLKQRLSNNHIKQQIKEQVLSLIKTTYFDFQPSFASEKLKEHHQLEVNPETLRLWMIEDGLWKPKKQRKVTYHAFRERMEYFGELQQFDGSYHLWFEDRLLDEFGNPQEVCLLASIDDATGKITQAKFDLHEGVIPVFNFWKEYVQVLGKPLKIYLDKFSTYKVNHKNAQDNSELLTQFQKAMKILGIELIPANSPQAKGRIERLFGTLQDRLVKELRLARISTIEEGNKFLEVVFIPKFNSQFAVVPAKEGSLHKELTQAEKYKLNSIFAIKSTRRINNDYTIQFKNHFYQLEEIQSTTIRPKDRVQVEQWLDNTLHFKFKGFELNFFLLPEKPQKTSRQPAILTTHPLNWKPPANHPWRKSFKSH